MTKKISIVVLSVLLIIFMTACTKNEGIADKGDELLAGNSLTDVYYLLIEKIYNEDTALNSGNYIGVDLSGILMEDIEELEQRIGEFAKSIGKELLLNTKSELKELDYIDEEGFKDGFLIIIRDSELSDDILRTSIEKYASNDGGIGYSYNVDYRDGKWRIGKETDAWIS